MLPMEWWWQMLFASSGLSKVGLSGKKERLKRDMRFRPAAGKRKEERTQGQNDLGC